MDSTVLCSIFALLGGAMLVAAGWQFTQRRAFVRHSAIASGTIVALTEERVSDMTSDSMNDELKEEEVSEEELEELEEIRIKQYEEKGGD